MKNIQILIPSYAPDAQLVNVVTQLGNLGFNEIIVVNDGNVDITIFNQLSQDPNVKVVHHAVNLGKGRALKTGLNYCAINYPDSIGVITVDADGQHLPSDVLKVSNALSQHPKSLILGARQFKNGDIPLRSKFGNIFTKYFFFLLAGVNLKDTQTGLRAIPSHLIPHLIKLKGERYEYEINMLLLAKESGLRFQEVDIETVYIENNKSSHFDPLWDSMRIYFLIIRFAASSIISAFADFAIFYLLHNKMSILLSTITARGISSTFNFAINKNIVFKSSPGRKSSHIVKKYFSLVILIGLLSFLGVSFINKYLGISAPLAKFVIDTALFALSFSIQRDWVFKKDPLLV